MEFDFIDVQMDVNMRTTKYGVMHGENASNIIVFIKMGIGSINPEGFNNKYLKIANKLVDEFGASVVVATTSYKDSAINHMERDMEYINFLAHSWKIDSPCIFFFGVSAGALIGLFGAEKYSEIKAAMYVNMPIALEKSNIIKKQLIKNRNAVNNQWLIYGDRDNSAFVSTFLFEDVIDNKKVKYITVKNADHHFSGGGSIEEKFIKLPELFFND